MQRLIVVGVLPSLLAGLALVGCASSNHAQVIPPTVPSLPSPKAVVRAAHAADQKLFAIFPALPGKARCQIPGPYVGPPGAKQEQLSGICETSVRSGPYRHPYGSATRVTFRERWRHGRCGNAVRPCSEHGEHIWRVVEAPPTSLKVIAVLSRGFTAPQHWAWLGE